MQENNFFLSALQPEDGVCSLALPSDQQLDRKSKEAPDAEGLKNARVQEQVRMRMLQKSHAPPRTNGALLDYELKVKFSCTSCMMPVRPA
ncbi:UNVERIFIED_CONTAM: Plakophilin-3 [Gekko kuhli]